MPCYTEPPTKAELNARGDMVLGQLEAVLCGVLTAHGAALLDTLDYAEIGVPAALVKKWWRNHQEEDRERKAREAAQTRKNELREQALAKLTPAEREALK